MSIFKLSKDSQNFIQQVATSGKATSLAFSIAFARALYVHTMQADGVEAETLLSSVNELVVLDRETVRKLLKSFADWHADLFTSPAVILTNPETAVGNFFEFNKYFNQVTLDAIKQEGLYIAQVTNQLVGIFNDLCTE